MPGQSLALRVDGRPEYGSPAVGGQTESGALLAGRVRPRGMAPGRAATLPGAPVMQDSRRPSPRSDGRLCYLVENLGLQVLRHPLELVVNPLQL